MVQTYFYTTNLFAYGVYYDGTLSQTEGPNIFLKSDFEICKTNSGSSGVCTYKNHIANNMLNIYIQVRKKRTDLSSTLPFVPGYPQE